MTIIRHTFGHPDLSTSGRPDWASRLYVDSHGMSKIIRSAFEPPMRAFCWDQSYAAWLRISCCLSSIGQMTGSWVRIGLPSTHRSLNGNGRALI